MSFITPNGSQTKLNEFGASLEEGTDRHRPLDVDPPPRRRWWGLRGPHRQPTEDASPLERAPE
jgi:hypothetical protein